MKGLSGVEGGQEGAAGASASTSSSKEEKEDDSVSFVLSKRRGSVLGKGTILKGDHFPGAQNKKLRPFIDGAPNFRQVEGLPVYGVAIPTVDGILNVLKEILVDNNDQQGGEGGKSQVCHWHNMREEPVLYINGKPFVLREMEKPFANVEYTGITSARVEGMEQRMKQDVLKEVGMFGGIMVCEESEEGDLINNWEAVEPGDVQTPREVYEDFSKLGYKVKYFRIPVTDERSPKEVDFDTLVQYITMVREDDKAALVFNCQMGRGRTTTAMIVASLLQVRARVAQLGGDDHNDKEDGNVAIPDWARETFLHPNDLLSPSPSPQQMQSPLEMELEEKLKAGDYLVIRSLLRVLEKGVLSKFQIDAVIDACAEFQSLREGIVVYRDRFLKAASEDQRNALQRVVIDYLERYFMLITFTSYLNTENPDTKTKEGEEGEGEKKRKSLLFKDWVAQRSELYSMRERLLWHNPLTAMEVHTSTIDMDQLQKDERQNEEDEEILSFIALRNGSVLGSHTILKEDHYPGLQSHILKKLEGAPNFRRASDRLPVFGLAIPTQEGIGRVLSHVGIGPNPNKGGLGPGRGASLIWFNMREEPVIYLNGNPYVLREHARPFKNMQEYSNISAARVESMEKRLKQDVLNEAAGNQHSVLVTRERIDAETGSSGSKQRVIDEEWEKIDPSDPNSVLTTADIFASLAREGYPIEYVRIPITDGRAPRLNDIDDIVSQAAFADPRTVFVFNCQGGAGRTTTGMVIGSLLHLRKMKKLSQLPHSLLSTISIRRTSVESLRENSSDYEIFDVARDHGFSDDDSSDDNEVLHSIEGTLKEGNYAVIYKLQRLLYHGDESKSVSDLVIDACGKLKNLRKAVFAYRKPRKKWGHSWGKGDESLQGRHAAFKKGIEYLERYFTIIVFASWLDSDAYHNGVGSFYEWFRGRQDLKELKKSIRTNPAAALSGIAPVSSTSKIDMLDDDVHVSIGQEHKLCLSSRCGVILKPNTILKSYLFPEMQIKTLEQVPGIDVFNFFQAKEVPIASACASTVSGMRRILRSWNKQEEKTHVVIIDLRQELVIYVKGIPYVLREINFATKSLNLAGTSPEQVLRREDQLKQDLVEESKRYHSQLLLHHEVSRQNIKRVQSRDDALMGGDNNGGGEEASISRDASKAFDVRADAQRRYLKIEAFWEHLDQADGGDSQLDGGICTMADVARHLQEEEGFSMSYVRFPWSRERSPTAKDMEFLHTTVSSKYCQERVGEKLRFLFLSHTGIGMGIRHVPVLVSCFYRMKMKRDDAACPSLPPLDGSSLERTSSLDQENRGILALTRVIPEGPQCKALVDKCISYFSVIGDIRLDIQRCKDICETYANEEKVIESSFVATRLLGLNYLQRYFYSIVYVSFLKSNSPLPFAEWFANREELQYLLDNLSL
jgi:protein-tyrosine phosphatase